MDALKQALIKLLNQSKQGNVEVEVEGGEPNKEMQSELVQGDANEKAKKRGESDLAPELDEAGEQKEELRHHGKEEDLLQQILGAIGGSGPVKGRSPMGLNERAAVGAREKLAQLKK